VSFLGFPFSCQDSVGNGNCFLDVLPKSGLPGVCINFDLETGFRGGFVGSERPPELLVLPFVEIVEDVSSCDIGETNILP